MRALIWRTTFSYFAAALLCVSSALAAENLSVKALPSIAIESGAPLPISISVGSSAASGVKVGYVSLIEKQYKRPIAPEGLRLCISASTPCTDLSLSLDANRSHDLWLWGVKGEGVYEGTVSISSAEKPAGEPPLLMTVYVSSIAAKVLGVVLIASSVVVAFLFSIVFRNLLNRKQLLIPAASVSETLSLLKARTARFPEKLSNLCSDTAKQIEAVQKSLEVRSLEGSGLPPVLPRFGSNPTVDAYKTYVALKSQLTQVLNIVVNEGLAAVEEFLSQSTGAPVPDAAIKTAVNTIEAAARYKSDTPPSEDAIRQAITAALQDLRAAAAIKSFFPSRKNVERPEQLRLEVAAINLASWAFVLFLTTTVGALALVLTGDGSLGFGTLADYVKCVLWGLGLPAGSQLASATTATVATTFGVPKVS